MVKTDCEHIAEREKTYRGSWKKRGGVGAFMMLARKWDRIETMLQSRRNNAPDWDIFEHCMRDVSGDDGTLLAEIRDLRQYLILVEAEVQARIEAGRQKSAEQTPVDLPRDPKTPLRNLKERLMPGTPEDGGHHATKQE